MILGELGITFCAKCEGPLEFQSFSDICTVDLHW